MRENLEVDPNNNELVLLTVGQTRCGKSTFVNKVGKRQHAVIGDSEGESTTVEVAQY